MADEDAGAFASSSTPSEYPEYAKEKSKCKEFLESFRTPTAEKGAVGAAKYMDMLERVANRRVVRVDIELDDVQLEAGPQLVNAIVANTRRYAELFAQAIDELLPSPADGIPGDDIADVMQAHRIAQLNSAVDPANGEEPANTMDQLKRSFPISLLRRYEVRFRHLSSQKDVPLREVQAKDIGKLVNVRCIVIRASDIKPLCQVATYTCDSCGYEVYQEVTGRTFMPVPHCVSDSCKKNKAKGRLHLQSRASKFVKYQELRVQELPEQVPVGHIPRSMTVVARGESTRECVPGDIVTLTGVFLPTPFTGYQAMRAGLAADTYIEAHQLVKLKKTIADTLTEEMEEEIAVLADNDPYNTLSRSIAPEIYGMEDVKKALLLQLVGGVTQTQADGMKTRGDINICLMGDPGVAKSQLLKHIAKLAPRAVYTTGKGSSGVGLTAAVVRDGVTNELTLEGGALVLADMGICCIDEFDKMDESDRTAIHEVMEQQTVSIAKAGITTTLNARTAILAAANPRYGRYNRKADPDAHVALQKNINLPAALLSRFDLLFLLLDEVDSDNDKNLAAHVTYVHKHETHPPLEFEPVAPSFIRQYITIARHIIPYVPSELGAYVVEAYVDMRTRDKQKSAATGSRSTLTPRQLLSILRMAQALARLEMRLEVNQKDIDEAIRLVYVSKASVTDSDPNERGVDADPISRIWNIIKDKALADGLPYVMLSDAEQLVAAAGLSRQQLEEFIAEYETLSVVQLNASRTRLDIVDAY